MIQGAWKRINTVLLLLVVLMLAGALAKGVFGGSLDPPGTPGPTMKTLEQVEPRTPISSLPYTISQPGSYYLTGSLTGMDGITVASDGVTIDLAGFALIGQEGSGSGVHAIGGCFDCYYSISVRNGTVMNWGGVGVSGDFLKNGLYEDLLLMNNGGGGIRTSANSIVRNVAAWGNGAHGILLNEAFAGGEFPGGIVEDCTATNNTLDGIQVLQNTIVTGNEAYDNGGSGIRAISSGNRIDGNNVGSNNKGIDIDAPGNVIIRNSSRGNPGGNYDILAGNSAGPIGDASTATSPWANLTY